MDTDYSIDFRPCAKRPACDFSALARVSNQSAISAKPSSRADLGHAGIHVGVLVGFAGDGGFQVHVGVADGQAGGRIADLFR